MMRFPADSDDFTALLALIAQRTGLQIRESDRATLRQTLLARCHQLNQSSVAAYRRLLADRSARSASEWSWLAVQLSNPESYFFRDRGQFQLLERQLLPELIARQRPQRRLRLWSAGCSTGEEPYSLAILLAQLLPDREQWDCRIIGTDFNPDALAKARRAQYSRWSFRALPARYQQQYFQPAGQSYQLADSIRRWVEFYPFNLVEPLASQPQLTRQPFDLILCRNAFIYFRQEAIAQALASFASALAPSGYLLTGHAELYGQNIAGFVSRVFSESILYQRQPARSPALPPPAPAPMPPQDNRPARPRTQGSNARTPTRLAAIPAPAARDLAAARRAFARKNYQQAAEIASAVLAAQSSCFEACELLAEIHANAGDYNQAIQFCHKALAIQPFAVAIYYRLAQIAEENSNTEETKAVWKKVVYLEPNSSWAHYELGRLYEREGDRQRACKLYAAAQQLLVTRSPDPFRDSAVDLTVAELQQKLAEKLARC